MDNKKAGKLYIFFVATVVLCFAVMLYLAVKNIAEINRAVGSLSKHAEAYATPTPVPVTLPPEIYSTPEPTPEPTPVPTPTPMPKPDADKEEETAAPEKLTEADTEKAVPIQPDAVVYVDGTKLGAFRMDGREELYVRFSDFAGIYDSEYKTEGTSGSFVFRGAPVTAQTQSLVIGVSGKATEISAPPLMKGNELYLPVDEFCAMLGYGILHDENNGINYYTYSAGSRVIPGGVSVKVLMYYSIGESAFTGALELHVSPRDFAAQVDYLITNGYDFITFEDLDIANTFEKPVMLTFNNGYEDFYTEVYPILQQYNIKATVFVITDNIGTGHYLNESQIREMSKSGLVSVQSGTANGIHQRYAADIRTSYAHSRLVITELTGIEPIALSYAQGIVSNDAFLELSNYYRFGAAGMGDGVFLTGTDQRCIYRTVILGGEPLETFITKLG